MLWYKLIRSIQAFKLSPSKHCFMKKDDSNTVAGREMERYTLWSFQDSQAIRQS